jgi:mRNA-degrading endonuclease RelE of RelBE toxin-antitoxin system
MFEIAFTSSAIEDLRFFKKNEQQLILERVEAQLLTEPNIETRNRKILRSNELAEWELRIEKFRVFYDTDTENSIVIIKAIGYKEHNTLFIGGEEFKL